MKIRVTSAVLALSLLWGNVAAVAAQENLPTTQETQQAQTGEQTGDNSASQTVLEGTQEGTPGDAATQAPQEDTATDSPADAPQEQTVETPPVNYALPDIEGHWAQVYLQKSVELNLVNGVNGKMLPDREVKVCEAITVLNRALGAQGTANVSTMAGLDQSAWYVGEVAKAAYLGIVDISESYKFNSSATRAETFVLICRAYGFTAAEADESYLGGFPDAGELTGEERAAAAALIKAGIVEGNDKGELRPNGLLTRAAFITMMLRIAPNFITQEAQLADITGGAVLHLPSVTLANETLTSDRVFSVGTQAVQLSGVTASGYISIKGTGDVTLSGVENTSLAFLSLDAVGAAQVTMDAGSKAETLVIAGTGGAVAYTGAARDIQITASGRTINLTGMQASRLTVAGQGNTIIMNGAVNNIVLHSTAKNTTLTLASNADNLAVFARDCTVHGQVSIGAIQVTAVGAKIEPTTENLTETLDKGLQGVTLNMGVPNKVLPGGSLTTQVTLSGVTENKTAVGQWYQNGKKLTSYRNDSFAVASSTVSKIVTEFEFKKDMETTVTMGFELLYDNPSTGEVERLYVEKTVPIENHSDEWYYQRDVDRVLGLVSSTYAGDYTQKYAVDNDYQSYEKEVFVNAKGYSSTSEYLLWINRGMQHVNVFTGSKGEWKLYKSFLVGTGATNSQTPTGLTTVSYKLAAGWTTSTYTVKPVVGFYPGTGYAFHSRLFYPGTSTLMDSSIGYPISHGCVRMYNDDVQWIYDNIPIGTTVAIY